MKVIGAGFGRTGTYSLKLALEELGLGPCFHMFELAEHRDHLEQWEAALGGREPDWEAVFSDYGSTVDFPACLYYAELMDKYPQAKIILTHREPRSWYRSAYNTILTIRPSALQLLKILLFYPFSSEARKTLRLALHNKTLIEDRLFAGRTGDEAHVIEIFEKHLQAVKDRVPAHRLLVYEVSEGWQPLCEFLQLPVPDVPFPSSNERGDFLKKTRDLFFSF